MSDLSSASIEDLRAELERRDTPQKDSGTALVVGTIGSDDGRPFIEVFRRVDSPDDLKQFNTGLAMRARYNSHRNYRGFYFKTDDFERLQSQLKADNSKLAEWVNTTASVKFFSLY